MRSTNHVTSCHYKHHPKGRRPSKKAAKPSLQRSRVKSRKLQALPLRLPKYYPWEVLRLVSSELSGELPESLSARLESAIRRRDTAELLMIGTDYGLQSISRNYGNEPLHKVAAVRLVSSLIQKHESVCLGTPQERRERCLRDVIALDRDLDYCRDVTRSRVFQEMKVQILRLLGPEPDIEEISLCCRHGPGSSTEHNYDHRSSYFKYENWPYVCSPAARDLLRHVISSDPRWVGALESSYRERYRLTPYCILNQDAFWNNVIRSELPANRITCVPKDGTKDRPIAIEPPGNVYLQLGIDGVFRKRLRLVGNSIDTQERNRRLVLEAEERGLATIDLSNASDTIHRDMVRDLLPKGWFELLDSVRSPYGMLPNGEAWRYAKISSMGNATTFVLETAIYWSLLAAVSVCYGHPSDTKSVFGDDLICMRYLSNTVLIYLRLIGGQPNETKSFVTGVVYESCGVDAFRGKDIRPVFLKKLPVSDLDIYADRNRLHLWWKKFQGVRIPASLDAYFFKFLKLEPMFGPENPEDIRSTLFEEDWRDSYYRAYCETVREIPARDFMFRKLMHTLRGSSEGGMFAVNEVSKRLNVVDRVFLRSKE